MFGLVELVTLLGTDVLDLIEGVEEVVELIV